MADSQDTRTAPFSRRAIMAGLAAAPVAGLPALAVVAEADPIFAAFAEFKRAKKANEVISKAVDELRGETFAAIKRRALTRG